MTTQALTIDQGLREQLRGLRIGRPGTETDFLKRLAAENGWSRNYARRVLHEYRRFLILATREVGAVMPSDAVEQAWHLHMLHPHSYWDELCDDILGHKLHQTPDDGDQAMTRYQHTLTEYRRTFGYAAPDDIWPPAEERLAELGRYRRVNLARIIRKTRIRVALYTIGASAISLLLFVWSDDLLLPLLMLLAGVGAGISAPLGDPELEEDHDDNAAAAAGDGDGKSAGCDAESASFDGWRSLFGGGNGGFGGDGFGGGDGGGGGGGE